MSCRVTDLAAGYHGVPFISDVSFTLEPGAITGIIGPNGAGKSTLLKAMVGLLPAIRGTVRFFDEPLDRVRSRVAYMPQSIDTDPTFPVTVLDVVLMGRYPSLGWFRRPRAADRDAAHAALDRVGMLHVEGRQIGALSGGQRQRVFLARALAAHPDALLMDEPFQGVDAVSEERIIDVLREERERGVTVAMVHHDLSTARDYCDRAVLVNRASFGSGAVDDIITPERLEELYGLVVAPRRDGGDA